VVGTVIGRSESGGDHNTVWGKGKIRGAKSREGAEETRKHGPHASAGIEPHHDQSDGLSVSGLRSKKPQYRQGRNTYLS